MDDDINSQFQAGIEDVVIIGNSCTMEWKQQSLFKLSYDRARLPVKFCQPLL